jgi:hypothetical protein
VNLVGHVAVAARSATDAPAALLAGAMLPDLGAIARVRLQPPAPSPHDPAARAVAAGIALHHVSDAAFHASPWFNEHNRELRDTLLDAGVDRGPARACAHAGLEMLLDGHLVADAHVAAATDAAFLVLVTPGPARDAAIALVTPAERADWAARLDHIGRSLDPTAYRSPRGVALRLERMTRGRTRIELRAEHVDAVADALEASHPVVARDATRVVDDVVAVLAGAPRACGLQVLARATP